MPYVESCSSKWWYEKACIEPDRYSSKRSTRDCRNRASSLATKMGWELVTSLRSLGRLALAILPQQIRLGLSVPGFEPCRCFPGDTCWPTSKEWASFNQSVNGNLVATVPLGAPCHDSSFGPYNATECSRLRAQWTLPELQYI